VADCSLPFFFVRIRPRRRSTAERRRIHKVRLDVFQRSGGFCELQLSPKCLEFAGWDYGHLCHTVHRSRGGDWSAENCRWGCNECHIGWQHNGGKPCPPKE
jgi:5-methylcytosine-specific restriction endonuclease McrA